MVGYRKDPKMMRFMSKAGAAVAVLVIAAMLCQAAVAQNEEGKARRSRGNRGGGGMGFGPPSMAMLAGNDKVQDALKLSDDQKDKIKKINSDAREEMRKEFQSGGRPDPEKMRQLRQDTSDKVKEVLNADQQKRLMGIFIQVMGAGAVMDPEVGKAIDLTEDQKTKIHDAVGPPPGGGQAGRGDRQSFQERREKQEKAVMDVLTADQKTKLESLKGEKVEIDMSALRGGGAGGRGRGRSGDAAKNSSTN